MSRKENRAYYLSRGLCPRCGGKAHVQPGRVLCVECQQKHDSDQHNRRAKWREEGRCTRCGRERDDPEKSMCAKCREYMHEIRKNNAEYAKERRDMLRERGICTRCGIRYAEPFRSWCSKCQQKHKNDLAGNAKQIERARKRREERKAAGLCIDCGRPSEGMSRCPRCNEMRRDSTRKYKIGKRIDAEIAKLREESRRDRRDGLV